MFSCAEETFWLVLLLFMDLCFHHELTVAFLRTEPNPDKRRDLYFTSCPLLEVSFRLVCKFIYQAPADLLVLKDFF